MLECTNSLNLVHINKHTSDKRKRDLEVAEIFRLASRAANLLFI
jgi:hypothetical protein